MISVALKRLFRCSSIILTLLWGIWEIMINFAHFGSVFCSVGVSCSVAIEMSTFRQENGTIAFFHWFFTRSWKWVLIAEEVTVLGQPMTLTIVTISINMETGKINVQNSCFLFFYACSKFHGRDLGCSDLKQINMWSLNPLKFVKKFNHIFQGLVRFFMFPKALISVL